MTAEFSNLRRCTFFVLFAAFAFGIGTLWMDALWPFAIFETVIIATACVWLFAMAVHGGSPLSGWLALPFLAACIGAAQFSLGGTQNAWQTRQSVFEWVTNACAALLAFQVYREERLRALSLRTFALTAGALALLSTVQNYAAPGRMLWLFVSGYADNVFGPFVSHTKLANFAELAMPVAIWLAVTETRARTVYAATAAVLAGTVVASGSRGGIIVLALEVITLGAVAACTQLRGKAAGRIAAFGIATAVSVAVCGAGLAVKRLALDPFRDLRLPIAQSAAEMARHYWLLGSGLGTWSTVYPEYARFDIHLFINQAHCDWLQWLSEGGILFAGCMVAMMVAALRAARREWWTLGLVFVWLHGLFDFPMQQTPAFATLQVAFWGAAVALTVSSAPRIRRQRAGASAQ